MVANHQQFMQEVERLWRQMAELARKVDLLAQAWGRPTWGGLPEKQLRQRAVEDEQDLAAH